MAFSKQDQLKDNKKGTKKPPPKGGKGKGIPPKPKQKGKSK